MREARRVEALPALQDEHVADVRLLSEAERESIRQQLEKLLASEFFVNSKRMPAFLRFIVEKTLQEDGENLKERMIGIAVFDRAPDYDCSDSPVVRVTAAELRKRLDLYYAAPERSDEIRITLPSGSYVPTFQGPSSALATARRADQSETAPIEPVNTAKITPRKRGLFAKRYVAFAAVAAVVAASSLAFVQRGKVDVVQEFWQPVIASKGDVALCFSQGMGPMPFQGVVPTDVQALNVIRGTLESRRHGFQMVELSSTDPADLKNQPIIYIGPFSRPWFQQATDSLRFHIERNPQARSGWIEDSQAPSQHMWEQSFAGREARMQTHAILARFIDKTSHQPIVIASGIMPEGTVASAEILTNPEYMKMLLQRAPKSWEALNLEAVIGTDIVDGKAAGTPKVEVVYFWK